jgi:uncharacterized protein
MKNYSLIIRAIKKEVKKRLDNEIAHDYWHVYRVVRMALKIGRKEKANLKVLELAGWLHDVAYPDSKKKHDLYGAEFSRRFLTGYKLDKKIIDQVAYCIQTHRFVKGKKPKNLEAKILQDADKLDTLGAVGLARIFSLSGEMKQKIHDPSLKPDFDYYLSNNLSKSAIAHFEDKIFKLKGLMYTKTAKKIAEKREKYMRNFLVRFYKEWEGKE